MVDGRIGKFILCNEIKINNMRIAHIHWSLGTGGIETMLPDIVNEQAKTNDVALIIINDWVEPSILAKVNQERVKVVLINRHEGSKNHWSIIKLNLFFWQDFITQLYHRIIPDKVNEFLWSMPHHHHS